MTFNRLFFLITFPSLLNPSHSGEQPHGPRTEGRSGRLDVQSPLPGYEANATVEISSAEVTLILLPSSRASFCSVCNSGEDVTMTPVSSEVDERQKHRKAGFTAAHAEERSNCIIYQSNGESSVSSSSHLQSAGRLVAMYSLKRESRRPKKRTGETFHTGKNTDRIKKFGITLELRTYEAAEGEKAALSRLSEAEYHTILLLEDPKNHILSEARSESYTVRSKI